MFDLSEFCGGMDLRIKMDAKVHDCINERYKNVKDDFGQYFSK